MLRDPPAARGRKDTAARPTGAAAGINTGTTIAAAVVGGKSGEEREGDLHRSVVVVPWSVVL